MPECILKFFSEVVDPLVSPLLLKFIELCNPNDFLLGCIQCHNRLWFVPQFVAQSLLSPQGIHNRPQLGLLDYWQSLTTYTMSFVIGQLKLIGGEKRQGERSLSIPSVLLTYS